MAGYFAERFEAIMALPGAIAQAPLLFLALFAVFGPLIWWKWRAVGRSTDKAMADRSHGLRAQADRMAVPHDTGIGTTEVLVMRPNSVGGMIWFALFFFGGGAVFFFALVLPAEPTRENRLTFAGLAGFAVIAMVVIEMGMTRIRVDETGLERRRVLHRAERIAFREIASVGPIAKSYVTGLVITSISGKRLRILARFSGYRELMERLSAHDPKLALLARLGQGGRHNA